MSTSRNLQDAKLTLAVELKAGAGTEYSDAVYLGTGPHRENLEIELQLPELNATELPDSTEQAISIVAGNDEEPTDVVSQELVAEGEASGALTARVKIPSTAGPYIRLKATAVGSTTNAAEKVAVAKVLG